MKLHQLSGSRQQAYLDGEPSSPLQAAVFGVATVTVMFGPVLLLLLLLVSRSSYLPKGMMELVTLFALMGWFAYLLPRVDAPQAWLSRRRRLKAGLLPTAGCPHRCTCPGHRPAGATGDRAGDEGPRRPVA